MVFTSVIVVISSCSRFLKY